MYVKKETINKMIEALKLSVKVLNKAIANDEYTMSDIYYGMVSGYIECLQYLNVNVTLDISNNSARYYNITINGKTIDI